MYDWPLSSVNWVNDVRPALESDYCSSSSRLHCWLLATSFSALTQTCFISKQSRQTYKVCSKLTCRRKPKRTSFLSNILCGLENTSTYLPIPYLPSYFRHFTMEADSAGLKLRKGRAYYGLTLFSKLHYITVQCDTMWYNMMQYNKMWCDAMRCDAIQHNTIRCNAMRCGVMQCNEIRYDDIWYVMIWYAMIR